METVKDIGRSFVVLAKLLSWRHLLGLLICAGGCLLLLDTALDRILHGGTNMQAALLGGGTAAAATALGTIPVLLSQDFSKRTYDCFLGFGAGVMLGATAFSLVVPALAAARLHGAGPLQASALVGLGVALGGALVLALDRAVRIDCLPARASVSADSLKRAWLFVWAVALHNLPEGLAIGVAYAGIDLDKANSLATGISIQDVPEGLVVALALRSVGYGRLLSVGLGVASGIIEPIAAVFGVALIGMAAGLLPIGLAAAAGAMLFVITHDVIPESHRSGHGTAASIALVAGFILMMVLDTALG